MLGRIITLHLIVLGAVAHAAPGGVGGSGSASSVFNSPDYGLCMRTPVNMRGPQVTEGLCKTIMDGLNNEPCMKQKIEEIYKKAQNDQLGDFKSWCGDTHAFTKSLENFKMFFMNATAAVIRQESNWKSVKAKKANRRTGKKALGVAQLSVESVQGYQCGCKGKIRNLNDIMNAKKNVFCMTGLSLTNILKDGKLGSGQNGDKTSYGFAKYNEPARESSDKRDDVMAQTAYYCSKARYNPIAYSPFEEVGRTQYAEGTPTSIAF